MEDEPEVPVGVVPNVVNEDYAEDSAQDAASLRTGGGKNDYFPLFLEFTIRKIRNILLHATEYTVKGGIIKKERYGFMDSNILTIMDQLAGAVNLARTSSRMIYVSRDGMGWFYSGKLPAGMDDFYIVYPDSNLDQIGQVPNIDLDEWYAHLSKTPPEPAFSKTPETKKGSILDPFKKYLITYSAFAPFIALAITFTLAKFLSVPDFWTLGFYAALCCSPLSLLFSLSALQKPKNSRVAVLCCMLASDAHMLFYAGLWLISFHGTEIVNPVGTAIAMMAALAMSGMALLLMYDNDLQKKVIDEKTEAA